MFQHLMREGDLTEALCSYLIAYVSSLTVQTGSYGSSKPVTTLWYDFSDLADIVRAHEPQEGKPLSQGSVKRVAILIKNLVNVQLPSHAVTHAMALGDGNLRRHGGDEMALAISSELTMRGSGITTAWELGADRRCLVFMDLGDMKTLTTDKMVQMRLQDVHRVADGKDVDHLVHAHCDPGSNLSFINEEVVSRCVVGLNEAIKTVEGGLGAEHAVAVLNTDMLFSVDPTAGLAEVADKCAAFTSLRGRAQASAAALVQECSKLEKVIENCTNAELVPLFTAPVEQHDG